jgi:hypothetical protein
LKRNERIYIAPKRRSEKGKARMSIITILLILLIIGAVGGGLGGWYPHTYGFGGGGLLLLILVVLLLTGRL